MTAPLLVLAIFQRREHPTPERAVLDEANHLISKKFVFDKTVSFLNIDDVFVMPDGSIPAYLMADFEHPTEVGYQRWAEGRPATQCKSHT